MAFLSVCTSATNRCCRPPPFCTSFQQRTSSYSRCTSSGSSSSRAAAVPRAMELPDRSKRPRNDDDDDDDEGLRGPDLDADCGGGMTEQHSIISPYENKMGRIISSCPKCHGEGKVRAPMSKKARALKMRSNSSNGAEGDDGPAPPRPETARVVVAPPPTKPCRACDGTGLVATRFPPPPPPSSSAPPPSSAHRVRQHSAAAAAGGGMVRPPPLAMVAIVGGGIGGIALAAALQHRGVPCAVYEKDASFEERRQGYGLTMQQGARALRSLGFFSLSDDDGDGDDGDNEEEGSFDESGGDSTTTPPGRATFGIHSTRHVVNKPCGTVVGEWGMRVWGGRFEKDGRGHAKRQNAHISRQNLRRMLLGMLRPGTVRWGHALTGYSRRIESGIDDGGGGGSSNLNLDLTFRRRRPEHQGGGGEEVCDDDVFITSATVLVGCDGIRSAVRAKKLGDDTTPLRYLGCIVVLGIAASPDSGLTDGKTVFQTADGVTRLYAMPYAPVGEDVSDIAGGILDRPDKHRGLSMWQLSFPMEEDEAKMLSQLGPTALKAEALKRCGRWHDPIPALLSQTPEDLITGYPCYDRATVEKDLFRAGCRAPETAAADPFVTMLGDAAHPMSPFKGEFLFGIIFFSSHLLAFGS